MAKHQKSGSFENLFVSESQRIIYAEISALKKRLHLLEGERKANYQLNDEELKNNEVRIQELREQNQKLKKEREEMTMFKDNYFELIANFFGDKKKAYEFKGKNYEEVKDILDCKIGDMKNKLNLSAFKKAQIQQDVRAISEKEQKLVKSSDGRDKNKNSRSDEIKSIENKIAEMKIKVTESENLQTRYKNMISTLTSSNLAKRISITQAENALVQQNKDIIGLKQTLSTALQVKKDSKAALAQMEEETLIEYGKREQSLFEARIKLKEIHEKMESIGAKLTYPKFHMIHRDSSLTEGLLIGFEGGRIIMSDTTISQNEIEKVYNQLQEMTGESDPSLIVQRFQQQREHSSALRLQLVELKSAARKCKLRNRFLEDKLRNLQFSGGQERQKLDEEYSAINSLYESTMKDKLDAEKVSQNFKSLMDEVFDKLNGLCVIVDIQLPETQIMDTSEKVVEILQLLYSTIEEMIENKEILFSNAASPMISPVLDKDSYGSDHESLASQTGSVGALSNYFFGSNKQDELSRLSDMSKLSEYEGPNSYLVSPGDQIRLQSSLSMAKMEDDVNSAIGRSPAPTIIKSIGRKSDSSEDEDAVGRNYIKRQSQALVEAKTRKGRFNAAINMTPRPRNY